MRKTKKRLKPTETRLKKNEAEEKPVQRFIIADEALSPIQKLVEVMVVVNTKSPQAQLNATSISDNNGGRIQLNDPTVPQPDFKKVTNS